MTRRRGFTLIELLVVIAIIALLMSILMPALSRVKKQAQSVTCMARLKSWGLLFKLYTDDNGGYFNEGWGYLQHTQNAGKPEAYGLWMNALRPYYKDEKMRVCPTATKEVLGDTDFGTFKAWYRDMENRYPMGNEVAAKHFVGSYSINNWTNYSPTGRGGERPAANFWKNTQNLVKANEVPLFGDNTWHDAWPLHTDAPVQHPFDYGWGNKGSSGEMNQFCIDRHSGWTNLAFTDWSVRHVGLRELWTLKWHRTYVVNGPYTIAGGATDDMWPQWLRKYRAY
ncbi:MAG: type II secretion system protein [Phycisphaerae bacterium]|nr:type II secretion system protein [Phycisphaerae bacterium]